MLVVSLVVAGVVWRTLDQPINVVGQAEFVVHPGATLGSVGTALAQRSILDVNADLYRYYGLITNSRGPIKAGEYRLIEGMSHRDLLALIRSGEVVQRQLTFPEGWTFNEWRLYLQAQMLITQTLEGKSNRAIMVALGSADLDPEGQFFPDTYQYSRGEADLDILRRAHLTMSEVMLKEWSKRTIGDAIGNRYEGLILASIVEKETGYSPDREKVAAVFLNRLQRNMRLQSDATVIYGLGSQFDGNLTRRHLREQNPYNTYLNRGLPPTPIAMPGLAAIRATLRATPAPYLYFVARGDGTSHFSDNLEEHNRAVAKYQISNRPSDYRSKPR